MIYAILDSEGKCINRVLWDGQSDWQPPDGCTAVADPDNLYPFHIDRSEQSLDPLASLTEEQKAALLALLQQS